MKVWIAIDPGASGSLCLLAEDNTIEFVDFKADSIKGYINYLKEIIEAVDTVQIQMVVIEQVRAMPGQGVSSMLSLGRRIGELEGMLQTLNIGYVEVRPQEWQKACGITPKSGKKGTYETVSKIYPLAELKGPKGGILDGRCDALGLAHYLRKNY